MKRAERVAIITKILSENPCKRYNLNYFCQLLNAAKTSISEDLKTIKDILNDTDMGTLQTISGAGGGIMLIPNISDEDCYKLQQEISERLEDSSRILGGGFLYTSDIMFDTSLMMKVATVFAKKFHSLNADYVCTIETKGIPLATMTAHMLNLPLVIIRRESRISEGSTLSINYFSGSNERIQKISISKRAVTQGKKAIIIDDFMRGGGSIKGLNDILEEFQVEIVGTGVVIASSNPIKKKINDYSYLVELQDVNEEEKSIKVLPNKNIFT